MEINRRLRRPCSRCNIIFTPRGKFERVCSKCLIKAKKLGTKKRIEINKLKNLRSKK